MLSGIILIAITVSAAFITATTFSSVIQKQSQTEQQELSSCSVASLQILNTLYKQNQYIFDNSGGNTWKEYISFPLTNSPSEHAQYKIVVNATNWSIYNVTENLEISGTNNNFWNTVNQNGSDIRVFNQNGNQLYFWIEEFNYTKQTAVIWINLTAGTSEVNIAYGNPSAAMSIYNDPYLTFTIFEDAETYLEGSANPDSWAISSTYGFSSYWVNATSTSYSGVTYPSRSIEVGGRRDSLTSANTYVYAQKPISLPADQYKVIADIFFHYVSYSGSHGAKLLLGSTAVYQGNPFSGSSGIIDSWYNLETTVTLTSDANTLTFGTYFNGLFIGGPYVALDNFIILKLTDPATFTTPQINQIKPSSLSLILKNPSSVNLQNLKTAIIYPNNTKQLFSFPNTTINKGELKILTIQNLSQKPQKIIVSAQNCPVQAEKEVG